MSGVRCSISRRPACRARLAAGIFAAIVAFPFNLSGQAAKATESQVKAAYLANFGRFVEWPSKRTDAKDPSFNICVLGQDPVGADLDAAVIGETIGRARLAAKKILRPEEAADCRVLFIASEDGHRKEIPAGLETLSVLTVSDMPEFMRRGGMVQFLLDGNKVRFEVNLEATDRVGLKLSSELLKLAVSVRRKP
jgi:hypothetical protein